jgi:hypothetical protein
MVDRHVAGTLDANGAGVARSRINTAMRSISPADLGPWQ